MTNATRSFAHSISVFAARAVCAKRPSVATRAMCAAQACALAALLATPAVAVASDAGVVIGWGRTEQGQLNMPSDLGGCIAIAGGWQNTVAIQADGTVRTWGYTAYQNIPSDLGACTQIAASVANDSTGHTVALTANGTVRMWGYNGYGQCNAPSDLGSCKQIAVGGGGDGFTLAIQNNGIVKAWGYNGQNQCSVPSDLGSCKEIAAGHYYSVAIQTSGTIKSWGDNGYSVVSDIPSDLGACIKVAACGYNTAVIKADGTVRVWGATNYGQTGVPSNLGACAQIAMGGDYHYTFVVALKKNGDVQAWGQNWYGQCNNPTGIGAVSKIAAGCFHTLAIVSDCNNNGIADYIDVRDYGALDQNADKIPDTCEGIDQFNITTANLGVPTANTAYSHTFTNLYPTYTDATLTIRAKGDLDSANEFFTVKLNDITYARIFDNTNSTGINCTNATNGGVSTVALTIPKATFAQYATAGELKVTLLASPYVTAGECADGSTTVQLHFQGLTPGAD